MNKKHGCFIALLIIGIFSVGNGLLPKLQPGVPYFLPSIYAH